MIVPFLSSLILYSVRDAYNADDRYGDTGSTTIPYGSDYGTGVYSEYNSERGRYTTTIEIAGYGSESGSGYGYTAGTESGSSVGAVSSSGYGYTAGDVAHSYEDGVFDYVVDVLDGDPERKPDRVELYIPVDTSTR